MRFRDLFHNKKRRSSDNAESYRFIKSTIDGYAKKIDAPESLLPTYGYSEGFSRPYIEIDSRKLIHFKVKKRGRRIEKKYAVDLKHIIYWVFEGVTASLARDYELTNRIENQDSRRQIFKKQEELIGLINSEFTQWCQNEHDKILKKNPFVDSKL